MTTLLPVARQVYVSEGVAPWAEVALMSARHEARSIVETGMADVIEWLGYNPLREAGRS